MSTINVDAFNAWLTQHALSLLEKVPHIRVDEVLFQIFDLLFSPRQNLTQLTLVIGLQAFVMLWNRATKLFGSSLEMLLSSNRRKQEMIIRQMTKEASSYQEWEKFAEELDRLRGADKWRADEDSDPLFDTHIIKKRTRDLLDMIGRKDTFNLIFRLRGGLAREQFGITNESLFSKAVAGTKHIIEDYHATVSYALNLIVGDADGNINASSIDNPDDGIPADVKLAFFNETRHAYGRTALLLSGGAYLGYYHMGVARALWYEGLFPRVISGASAGSLIAGMLGTRNDAEMEEVFSTDRLAFRPDHFCHSTQLKSSIARSLDRLLPRSIYWIGNRLLSIIFDGKLFNLDGEHFKRVVLSNIGPYTFQEAFDRTGRIINITVAPLNTFDPPRLLNYLTAPHVCVWSAAVASCALPGVFDSSPLIVKEPNGNFRPEHEWGRQGASGTAETEASSTAGGYSDGSLENDLPMQQLSELFNVNHFIVSQANPHSALLSSLSLRSFNSGGTSIYSGLVSYVRFLKAQLRSWLRNFVTFLNFGSDVSPWTVKRGIFQTITQDYEGRESDVTIMPWVGDLDVVTAFLSILKNPTIAEYRRVVAVAEANTWPFISRIRAHCQVEMTLDKCVQRLRKYMSSYRDQKRGMDRTPSFYTSRSIINLSGLSVADPIPATLHERPQGALSKKPSREFVRRHSVDNLRRISTNSSSNLNLYDFGSNAQERGSVGSSATGGMQKVGGGHDDFEPGYGHTSRSNSNDIDDLALTLSVRGADAELATESPQQMKRSRSKESNATNVSDKSESATTSPSHSFHSHNSREHIQEPAASGIHKTTSMANFYYKRSEKSNENLSNMK